MLQASGGRKYERACEAEASRIAGSGKAGRCGAEACLPRGAQLSSFYALWTWKKAWFRQPEALLSKRAKWAERTRPATNGKCKKELEYELTRNSCVRG